MRNGVGVDESDATVAKPHLARTCWEYILRVLGWACKCGFSVNLDLHNVMGSQKGYLQALAEARLDQLYEERRGPRFISLPERSAWSMRRTCA